MAIEITNEWLKSGEYAAIGQKRYRPLMHPCRKDTALIVQRGQADVIFLRTDSGDDGVLKSFRNGRAPAVDYLQKVAKVLPRLDGLKSGTGRSILNRSALQRRSGCYFSAGLQRVIDGAVLMPRVMGTDWGVLSQRIRDGDCPIDLDQRTAMCRSLTKVIAALESAGCAHRDLSPGNVLLHTDTWEVSLTDFDGLYHPSLKMPVATAAGSEGYIPTFAFEDQTVDPGASWCRCSDRFALAILNAEFLTVGRGDANGADGGMFTQDELCALSGQTIGLVAKRLSAIDPALSTLFNAALSSESYARCPPPARWEAAIRKVRHGATNSLAVPDIDLSFFRSTLDRRSRRWSPPRSLLLPDDPWEAARASSSP